MIKGRLKQHKRYNLPDVILDAVLMATTIAVHRKFFYLNKKQPKNWKISKTRLLWEWAQTGYFREFLTYQPVGRIAEGRRNRSWHDSFCVEKVQRPTFLDDNLFIAYLTTLSTAQ
jgi:hypothetical protein